MALYQIVTSIGFYLTAVAPMHWSLELSCAATLLLVIPASLLLVRVFIVQHDCGHRSFFAGTCSNSILGAVCGVLTLDCRARPISPCRVFRTIDWPPLRRAFGEGNPTLWDESLHRLVRFRDVRFVEPQEQGTLTAR